MEPPRTQRQAQTPKLRVDDSRQKQAVPERESPPAKRLRSSAAKSSIVAQPPGSTDSPASSQQTGRRPRRATLAPLANGVAPARSAPHSSKRKSRSHQLQVTSAAPQSAAKQSASSRRRLRRATATGGAEEPARQSAVVQAVSEPVSSPADGPAGATRRARLLQQQIGCVCSFPPHQQAISVASAWGGNWLATGTSI